MNCNTNILSGIIDPWGESSQNGLTFRTHFQCTQVSERHQQGQSWFWDSREAIRSEPFESLGYPTRSQTSLGRGHFWVGVIDVGFFRLLALICRLGHFPYTFPLFGNHAITGLPTRGLGLLPKIYVCFFSKSHILETAIPTDLHRHRAYGSILQLLICMILVYDGTCKQPTIFDTIQFDNHEAGVPMFLKIIQLSLSISVDMFQKIQEIVASTAST